MRSTSSPSGDSRWERRELAIVALLVAFAARVFWLGVAIPASGVDYYQFWLVGRAQARGDVANIYSRDDRPKLLEIGRELAAEAPGSKRLAKAVEYRHIIETFSTPFLYSVVGAPGTGDYATDLTRFELVSLISALVGVAILCRLAGYAWTTSALVLLAILSCCDPLASDVDVANVNSLQLGALAAYLWLAREPRQTARELLAGATLGFLVAFKPTLGLAAGFLAIGWLARRDWRTLLLQGAAGAAAVSVAVLVSSAYLASGSAWLDWLAALPELERAADVSVANGNFALARLASEAGAPDLSPVFVVALALAMAWASWRGARGSNRSEPRAQRDFLALALGCAASVVALRLAWLHYYLLLVPLALFLLRPGAASGARLVAIGLASVAVLGGPLRVVLREAGASARPAVYIVGAVALVALGLAELARAPRPLVTPVTPKPRRA